MREISRRGVLTAGIGAAAVAVAAGGTGYELMQDGTLPGEYRLVDGRVWCTAAGQ